MQNQEFQFTRGRGLVWVCDIEGSSKFLNDNDTAAAIEEFLPRFHWIARIVVQEAQGQFIKWTGDGFLAWFPLELHRDLGEKAAIIFDMIWHLTILCNVTGLDVDSKRKFRIRHGVALEHDALITHIIQDGSETLDLIGRAVVLAFRLSGIKAAFPSIVTQREIIGASKKHTNAKIHFKKLKLDADERLKYFKGERWGLSTLYASVDRQPRRRGFKSTTRQIRKVISEAEKGKPIKKPSSDIADSFFFKIADGPVWSRNSANEYFRYLKEDLLGNLKSGLTLLEKMRIIQKE